MSSSDDRGVLLELYMATNGPAWRSNEGWNTSASISCWYGVTVNKDGRVTMLNLSLNGLQGEASRELNPIVVGESTAVDFTV